MSATRSRKEQKTYKKHLKQSDRSVCAFCQLKKGDPQFLRSTKSFKIIRNVFPYSIWDGQRVVDHLMIVPKQHTDALEDLSPEQAAEFLKLVGSYEREGYNVYARAPASAIKSIVHQHTHLIKTLDAPKKFIFLLRRPYIRVVF